MKNLKHILVYEAFSSRTISKTLEFLDKKVGKNQKKRFLNVIKKLKDRYDYPIDLINDKWINYLSKKEAYLLKSDKTVDNPYGIQYLKFWFSIEGGYLGYSGVGNKVIKHEKKVDKRGRENHALNEREVKSLIDENILHNKGKLVTVSDYSKLKHLDKCIISIDYKLIPATIWILERRNDDDQIYAIQEHSSGSTPGEYGDERDWREYGRYSWSMGTARYPGDDHEKLHIYVEDDKPLRVVSDRGEVEEEKIESENPLDYNLPLDSYGYLTYWGNQSSIDDEKEIENADFAIILNFDSMISSEYKNPSFTKSERGDAKKGATKLLSDHEVKNANIERYIGGLLKRLGINRNEFTPKNLQKIILLTLQGDFALMSCKLGYINSINDIVPRIADLIYIHNNIDSHSNTSIESYHKKLLDQYKKMYNNSLDKKSRLKSNLVKIKEYYNSDQAAKEIGKLRDGSSPAEDIKIILDKVFSIGQKIYDGVEKLPVDNIVDLKIIYQKLRSIRSIINDEDEFYIGSLDYLKYLADYPNNISDTTYSLNRLSTSDRKKIIEALNNIDRYVDSVFR